MVPGPTSTPSGLPVDEQRLVSRLRSGDIDAFETLVGRWTPSMLRVARAHVSSVAVAEEVVQEAWIAVLSGLDGFEERAALQTWVFRILANKAKTRGVRDRRSVPFASLAAAEADELFSAVDGTRFRGADDPYPGHWAAPLPRWDELPESRLTSRETIDEIRAAIDALPPAQRTVMALRDIAGLDSADVCDALGLTEGNQRVLLHRARSRVRATLERELTA